ncbi:2,4-dienoyl-CoA reductase [Alicyclobacillus dauci]|uniref:2,4-dienoyl-CoA reductase n=1 Tax=Alicyclobacillus dauci TaxID=1475485 RepID=A0ABY6ZAK5_9BACL|nr:2,4-dienoyl-CoA reductase [Alicyclobacillus dauci]WAH39269.1 2,4-dienoyl-CoA reductase [Alicyclobacillus dauci]
MLPAETFANQTVVITGGGTGLGKAMALELTEQGANIVIASRKKEHLDPVVEQIRSCGGHAVGVPMDVRQSKDARRTLEIAIEAFGGVDHLINNAAGNFICPAEKLSDNGWRAICGIILDGTFYMSRTFGEYWIGSQKKGTITNIVTTGAFTSGPGTVHNASAKAGVIAMTRTLAVEWGQYGIRVNAIAPGPIEGTEAGERLWSTPEAKRRVEKSLPMGQLGKSEDISHAVCYLMSPYSGFINGECLVVDGGRWLNNVRYDQ